MVEWKKIGDCIISLKTGLNPRKNFVLNSEGSTNYYITVRELDYWKIIPSEKTDKVDDNAIRVINNRSNLEEGDVLFSGTGTIGRTALVNDTPKNWNIKEGVYSIKPRKEILNSKFLIELFHSYYLINIINEFTVGDPIRSVPMKNLVQIQIPIPPLSEQQRIVEQLDTFTSSIDNLKEQIAQRRKQYEYYRDQLLELTSKEWPIVTLKDVAVIKNGKDYKSLLKGNIPVYGSGGIMTYVSEFASEKPSVLLPRKGSVENIFYVEEPFWTVDTIYWTDINTSKVLPKYLYDSLLRHNLKDYAYGGARPSLSQPILYKLEIPLPPLSEQQRIVSILDTFESSINNLEQQLALREKQYEYYRNKLLTFE